jgi:hypothetical protein
MYFLRINVCTDITGSLEQNSRQIGLNFLATMKLICGFKYTNTSDAIVMVSHSITRFTAST